MRRSAVGMLVLAVAVTALQAPAPGAGATAGSIVINAPVGGAWMPPVLSSPISYTASNLDTAHAVDVAIDGTDVAQLVTVANGSKQGWIDARSVAQGPHQLTLSALDTDGATVTSSAQVFVGFPPQWAVSVAPADCHTDTYQVTLTNGSDGDRQVQVDVAGVKQPPVPIAARTASILSLATTASGVTTTITDITYPAQGLPVLLSSQLDLPCEAPPLRTFDRVHPGVLAVVRLKNGAIQRYVYSGDGHGHWLPRLDFGVGWSRQTAIFAVGAFTDRGPSDVISIETGGYLRLYHLAGGVVISGISNSGTGWQAMDLLVGPGDFDGDGHADLLARERANGNLWLYPGDGTAKLMPRRLVGSGWSGMDAILGVGDFDGDGHMDVMARARSNGTLYLYPGNGNGGWLPRRTVGSGWSGFDQLVGFGDFDGDGHPDLLARVHANGDLYLYRGDGHGAWLPRARVGSGWGGFTALI